MARRLAVRAGRKRLERPGGPVQPQLGPTALHRCPEVLDLERHET
jgi:hypothetical protein